MPPTTRKDPRKAKGGAIDEKTKPPLQQDHLAEDSFDDEETICQKGQLEQPFFLSLRPTMAGRLACSKRVPVHM